MDQLAGHSITYRIALGKVAGFSLHAGVAVKAHERRKQHGRCTLDSV